MPRRVGSGCRFGGPMRRTVTCNLQSLSRFVVVGVRGQATLTTISGYEKIFRKFEFTQGILHGVQKAGELLVEHFPRGPDDRDELPDNVAHD